MKNRSTLSAFILLTAFIFTGGLFAQGGLSEGCIITEGGGELCGWIDLKKSQRNNSICYFTEEKGGELTAYAAGQIEGYTISGRMKKFSREVDIDGEKKRVFLNQLVDGKVDLFSLEENGTVYYLMEVEGQRPVQLKQITKQVEGPDQSYTIQLYQYMGLLKAAMADCQEVFPQIDQLRLNRPDLVKLAESYHSYTCLPGEECLIYSDKGTPGLFYLSPVLEFSRSTVGMTQTVDDRQLDFAPVLPFSGGLSISVPLVRKWNELDIEAGAMLGSRTIGATFSETDGSDSIVHRFSFDNGYLRTNLGLRFKHPLGKCMLTLYGGLILNVNRTFEIGNEQDYYTDGLFKYTHVSTTIYYPSTMTGFSFSGGLIFPVAGGHFAGIEAVAGFMGREHPLDQVFVLSSRSFAIRDQWAGLKLSWYFPSKN
ncbi:MAG: hypothetical protein ACOYXB_13380 [Bacteroidota bacterium]